MHTNDVTSVVGNLSGQEAGAGAVGHEPPGNLVVQGQNSFHPTCATGRVEGASLMPFQQDSDQAVSESNRREGPTISSVNMDRTGSNKKEREPGQERVARTPAKATGSPFAPRKHVTPEISQPSHGLVSSPDASSRLTASMSAQSWDNVARALVSVKRRTQPRSSISRQSLLARAGVPEQAPAAHRANGATTPEGAPVLPFETKSDNDAPIVDDDDVLVWFRLTGRLSYRLVVLVLRIALFGWHLFGVFLIICALYAWLS